MGFPTIIFFPLFLPQPLALVQHTESHTYTHDTPINLSKPITTNTEPHTHTNTNHQTINKATHTNTNHQQSHTHTHHQTSWSKQRPPHLPSKPSIRNPRRRFETHRSKPIKKKSSLEPPSELPMINPTDQQIPTHRSKPSSPIHNER